VDLKPIWQEGPLTMITRYQSLFIEVFKCFLIELVKCILYVASPKTFNCDIIKVFGGLRDRPSLMRGLEGFFHFELLYASFEMNLQTIYPVLFPAYVAE
jgi:hypothetical protein